MQKITEVRWHGRGGQGAVTAAKVLAESALSQGKHIQAFPEYGPERMGAPIRAFTRISDESINIHSHVTNPEIVAVLDPTLLEIIDVTEGTDENAVIIINTDQAPDEIRQKLDIKGRKIFTVDATSISLKEIGRNIPNTPMIGALIKATDIMKLEVVLEDFKTKYSGKFKQEVIAGNLKAIQRAYDEVKSE